MGRSSAGREYIGEQCEFLSVSAYSFVFFCFVSGGYFGLFLSLGQVGEVMVYTGRVCLEWGIWVLGREGLMLMGLI